jgi:hypothetical protein
MALFGVLSPNLLISAGIIAPSYRHRALDCGDILLDLTIFYKLRTELRESLTLADPGQGWLVLPAQHHAAIH